MPQYDPPHTCNLADAAPLPPSLALSLPLAPPRYEQLGHTLIVWALLLNSYCSARSIVVEALRRMGELDGIDHIAIRSRRIADQVHWHAREYASRAYKPMLLYPSSVVEREWYIYWNCVGSPGIFQGPIARPELLPAMFAMRNRLRDLNAETLGREEAVRYLAESSELLMSVVNQFEPLFIY